MARVRLQRDEVEDKALPFVCLRCGRPASLWKAKHFLLASRQGSVGKLTEVMVPLCSAHKSHWFWRGLFGWGVGGVVLAAFFTGLLASANRGQVPAGGGDTLAILFAVSFFGLVLWLPVMLVVHFTSIRPTKVTEDDITLAGVSKKFVEKLKEYRRLGLDQQAGSRAGRDSQVNRSESKVLVVIGGMVFLALGVAIVAADIWAVFLLYSQFQSTAFPQTTGRIVSSELSFREGGRKRLSSYTVKIAYNYTVDGENHQSDRYRYPGTSSHREDGPKQIVDSFSVGKEVVVYYNPNNPSEAVLSPGLAPVDFEFAHLLLPFNCFVAVCALFAWRQWRLPSRPAGGAAFVEQANHIRIYLHQLTAGEKALGITGLINLAVAVAFMIFSDAFVPAEPVMAAWASVPIAFIGAYVYFRPQGYLELDALQGRIRIPSGRQGKKALEIRWSAVADLKLEEVEKVGGVAYSVVLSWSGEFNRETRALFTQGRKDCAKRFFDWLYPRLMESSWIGPKDGPTSGEAAAPPDERLQVAADLGRYQVVGIPTAGGPKRVLRAFNDLAKAEECVAFLKTGGAYLEIEVEENTQADAAVTPLIALLPSDPAPAKEVKRSKKHRRKELECAACGELYHNGRLRCPSCGEANPHFDKPRRTRQISIPLLVGGVFFALLGGGTLFIVVDASRRFNTIQPVPVVPFLVVGGVLLSIGALLGWVAFRGQQVGIAQRTSRTSKYKSYDDVPWYRREPGALVFLAAVIFAPVTIALCIICLTGDVYRNEYDNHGNLYVWGIGNKIAAVLILVIQIGLALLIFRLNVL